VGNRNSALAGHYQVGKSGILLNGEKAGVHLQDVHGLKLYQVAAWANSINAVGAKVANTVGCERAPGPCKAASVGEVAALRIEPLKWWLYGVEAPEVDAEQGAILDISHSRTQIRVSGPEATSLLNRHLPLDLRGQSFPVGSVASTMIHHVGVTLWRSDNGYELFIPRGFALSLWEGIVDSATQFGVEIA
jgi:heterotetrameric sarcosine oxidase gamma subunit